MLFILRKIRRSLFLPGKVRTYMAYAAGEIVLIVVGILLALQISEWNQSRKDRVREEILLNELVSNLQTNVTNLEGDIEYQIRSTERFAIYQITSTTSCLMTNPSTRNSMNQTSLLM